MPTIYAKVGNREILNSITITANINEEIVLFPFGRDNDDVIDASIKIKIRHKAIEEGKTQLKRVDDDDEPDIVYSYTDIPNRKEAVTRKHSKFASDGDYDYLASFTTVMFGRADNYIIKVTCIISREPRHG